jgi:hypothetical protein
MSQRELRISHRLQLLLLVLCLIPVRASAQAGVTTTEEAGVIRRYDRFDDSTQIGTKEFDLATTTDAVFPKPMNSAPPEAPASHLLFVAYYVCEGRQTSCKTPWVVFHLSAINELSAGWQYIDFHDLYLLAAGKRVEPETTWDGKVTDADLLEFMSANIKTEDFLALVKSSHLEGRLGMTELPLEGVVKDALRALAANIEAAKTPVVPQEPKSATRPKK